MYAVAELTQRTRSNASILHEAAEAFATKTRHQKDFCIRQVETSLDLLTRLRAAPIPSGRHRSYLGAYCIKVGLGPTVCRLKPDQSQGNTAYQYAARLEK